VRSGLGEGTGACVVGPASAGGLAALVGLADVVGLAALVGLVACVGLVAVADGRSVEVGEAFPDWLTVRVGEGFAVLLLRLVDVDDGENIAGAVGDEDGEPVHADTVAETRTIKVAQLTAVSLALFAVPGVVMRTFMKPHMPSEKRDMPRERRLRFPLPVSGIGIGREYALSAWSLPAPAEAGPRTRTAIYVSPWTAQAGNGMFSI
jgi:hypothetical protein